MFVSSVHEDSQEIYSGSESYTKIYGYDIVVTINETEKFSFYLRQKEFPKKEQIFEEVKMRLKEVINN